MSKFNKMFIGSVVTASMFALAHTGAWAYTSARTFDASQQNEIASTAGEASNTLLGLLITVDKTSTEG